MNTKEQIRILLVEGSPLQAQMIEEVLKNASGASFKVSHTTTLKASQEPLKKGSIDLILLDLNLPDSQGLATVEAVQKITQKRSLLLSSPAWRMSKSPSMPSGWGRKIISRRTTSKTRC